MADICIAGSSLLAASLLSFSYHTLLVMARADKKKSFVRAGDALALLVSAALGAGAVLSWSALKRLHRRKRVVRSDFNVHLPRCARQCGPGSRGGDGFSGPPAPHRPAMI